MTTDDSSRGINGRLHEYHPLLSLGNLIVLVGAALILWGMVNSMETRISQNEELLKEVRLEVRLLSDVNRRLAALEASVVSRQDLLEDYIGTRSTFDFRLNALEQELRRIRSEKSADDETQQ